MITDAQLIGRLAVLEERADKAEKENTEILQTVQRIENEINKYKGFIGSVWFVISCVGIFFSTFKFFHKG